MDDCYFCRVIATKPKKMFFNHENFIALWDGNPLVPGHALITPKRHVQYIEQLTDVEISELMPLARQLSKIIRATNLEDTYVNLLDDQTNEMSRDYFQNCLDKVREYNRPPEAFNFGINDGPEAGQSVHHVHLHVIPRWAGDVENPKGGIRNMFSFDKYSREP